MKMSLKSLSNFLLIIAIGFLAAFIIVLADWTAPAFTPPTCPTGIAGCDIPLNTGAAAQTKTGMLNINENWNPNQQLSINSNQIWKSVTTGDPNLYLQWSTEGGAVSIGDNVGAANSLYVHGGGYFRDNVGIGMTPGGRLSVLVPANSRGIESLSVSAGNTHLPWIDNWNYISGNGVIFRNPAMTTETMRIDMNSGNVGIGTTAPLSKLSVGGSGISNVGIYSVSVSNGSSGNIGVYGTSIDGNSIGMLGFYNGAHAGVYGFGTNYGVVGSGGTYGVYGTGSSYGVFGAVSSLQSAIYGQNSSNGNGISGSSAGSGDGVYGSSITGDGVYGFSQSGYGVVGWGGARGGIFQTNSTGYNLQLPSRDNLNRGIYLYAADGIIGNDINGNTVITCPNNDTVIFSKLLADSIDRVLCAAAY